MQSSHFHFLTDGRFFDFPEVLECYLRMRRLDRLELKLLIFSVQDARAAEALAKCIFLRSGWLNNWGRKWLGDPASHCHFTGWTHQAGWRSTKDPWGWEIHYRLAQWGEPYSLKALNWGVQQTTNIHMSPNRVFISYFLNLWVVWCTQGDKKSCCNMWHWWSIY